MKALIRVLFWPLALTLLSTKCEIEDPEVNLNGPFFTIVDTAFFNALIDVGVDADDDGKVSNSEADVVEHFGFGLCRRGIVDLTGIEHFINLKDFHCHDNEIRHINLSKNTALEAIELGGNQLTHLDVSNNTSLKH